MPESLRQVNVRLPASLIEAVNANAKRDGISVSESYRALLTRGLAKSKDTARLRELVTAMADELG